MSNAEEWYSTIVRNDCAHVNDPSPQRESVYMLCRNETDNEAL